MTPVVPFPLVCFLFPFSLPFWMLRLFVYVTLAPCSLFHNDISPLRVLEAFCVRP
jgi:hypothetical protein